MEEKKTTYGNQKIRHVVNALTFILLLFIIIDNLTWLYRNNNIHSREGIIGFETIKEDIDVVTIGSSNLTRYYIPLQAYADYGFTSYNYATSSGRGTLLRYYIEEVEKYQSPKLYVVNIGGIDNVGIISESGLRNWSDSLSILNATRIKGINKYIQSLNREDIPEDCDILSYYFDIAKYHANRKILGKELQYEVNFGKYDCIDKGFDVITSVHPFDTTESCVESRDLSEIESKTLTDLLDYCDNIGINVLFIFSPAPISEPIINAASKMIQDRGFTVLNLNDYYEEMGIDFSTDYADAGHVNYIGAEKVTDFLGKYLKENYELPDHRGDVAFSDWDNDVEQFAGHQAEWKAETESNILSMISSRDRGKTISEIANFDEWLGTVTNSNYSLLIVKRGTSENSTRSFAFSSFINDAEILLEEEYYVGIYSGEKIYAENSSENTVSNEGGIGLDRKTQSKYYISSGANGTSIRIDDVEYASSSDGIQIVVFDNNYMQIYDNVKILSDEMGNVTLERLK